jgi:microbial collagenase
MACTSDDLTPLGTPTDLLNYLQSHDWTCLQYLWSYDTNVRGSYNDDNMLAVLAKIASLAPNYQGTNANNLRELLIYVRIGYYHQFYHDADPGLFTPAVIQVQADAAFLAFATSPHFNDFTADAGLIVTEWINAVDAGQRWDGVYAKLVQVVADYWNQPPRQPDTTQQVNVWYVFLAFERAVFEQSFQLLVDANFIALVRNYAINTTPAPGAAYLVVNAIYMLGVVGQHVAAQKPAIIAALNDAFAAHPHLSEPWLWAVDALCKLGACPSENGQVITKEMAAAELEAQLFPNLYTFDDGAIVVRTPVAIGPVQDLYHAIKEVAAQFNRVTETIPPLPGDPNGALTMKIYGSRNDYVTWHPFLTGLPTNNGGIYYEQTGTFYTYARPPLPGDYTLEELTRHEYGHYLIGRFLISGLWGQAPIYDNNRLVWFDEGFAEFLTGSSATGGIRPRKHLANLVAGDGPNGRMSIAQVLSANYGNFIFYRYAGFFFHFMYTQRRDLLRQFIGFVRAAGPVNDAATQAAVNGFVQLCTDVGGDPAIEAAYQAYLDQIVATAGSLTDPSTTAPPLAALASNDTVQIQAVVRTTRLGYLTNASVSTKAQDTRFTCRGYLSGQPVNMQDVNAAWTLFNANLEELLGDLRAKPFNNFQWTVARFGPIRFQASGQQAYPIADYYVEGPLGPENSVPPPPAGRIETDFHSTRLGGGAMCALANGVVTCTLALATQAFAPATPDAILLGQLADELDELRNQVYAINPPYYRDFECAFAGPPQTLTTQQGGKYMVQTVTATVKVPS